MEATSSEALGIRVAVLETLSIDAPPALGLLSPLASLGADLRKQSRPLGNSIVLDFRESAVGVYSVS